MNGTTRRGFVAGGIASLVTLGRTFGASGDVPQDRKPNSRKPAAMRCLDYGLSFLCNPSPKNSVRFWIESRTTIIDDQTGQSADFYQCASCKSENTFGQKDLLYQDNYDFMPIFGGPEAEDLLIFRRPAQLSERYRQIIKSEQVWGKPILKLREGKRATELTTWEEIRDATQAAIPIVTRTEINNPDTKLRAIIECPVKTMNISLERKMYQVDTGPIALPDLGSHFDPAIESLRLAFVVFNAPHFADFVIEQPTAVVEDGQEKCKVYHYSNPISLPAKNTVFAVEPAGWPA